MTPYSRVILRVLPKNPQGCFAPQTPLSMTHYTSPTNWWLITTAISSTAPKAKVCQ